MDMLFIAFVAEVKVLFPEARIRSHVGECGMLNVVAILPSGRKGGLTLDKIAVTHHKELWIEKLRAILYPEETVPPERLPWG